MYTPAVWMQAPAIADCVFQNVALQSVAVLAVSCRV